MNQDVACPSCGAALSQDARFCRQCGVSIEPAAAPAAVETVSSPPPAAAPPVAPPAAPPPAAPPPAAPPPAAPPLAAPPLAAPPPAARPPAAVPPAARPTPPTAPPSSPANAPARTTGRVEVVTGTDHNPMLGQASPNATYQGMRLLYEPGEDAFDPVANKKYLIEVFIRAFVIMLIWIAGEVVISIGGLIVSVAARSGAIVALGFLVNAAWSLALACVFWFVPLPAIISEWKLTIDGKGPAADTALDHVAWVLQQRGTPLKSVTPRELKVPGQPSRVYLQIREGLFTGFISCFAFGDDLYIGWTFWIYMSPARWCLHVISRILQNFRLRGSALYITLRYDVARATREAMHSAVREGVDVAAGRITPSGQGTVGSFIATRPDPMTVG